MPAAIRLLTRVMRRQQGREGRCVFTHEISSIFGRMFQSDSPARVEPRVCRWWVGLGVYETKEGQER